ncbi:MAG: gluconate 2-dehydrogenase subunit 3 family protein [Bacteroidetes bacterium]|nr:gluconate 2-dehydrogenase subunit 3 family protein [Bacteroidota bacterium]
MWILPEQTTGFLNDIQKAQLTVLYNAIMPGDAVRKVPNAAQAGAVTFTDLLLARDVSVFEDIPKWQVLYPKALQALDEQAQQLFSKSLQQLNTDEATTLIAKLETNALVNFVAGSEKIDQAVLFDTLRRHCIQGCFADNRWGANQNRVMWKWFGYQEETKEPIK